VPAGFEESVVFSGLTQPTAVRFASDGRVFVAEKSGIIKVFDSLTDTTATVFADLNVNVYNYWDRGLLGLALDPNFPASPYVYVLYTYDAPIGGTAPRWGTTGVLADPCPTPPGPNADGCVASGRLSRLQANGNQMTGSEQVLVNDWCQQYPSLSVGSLVFGADGALYASGGTASSFTFIDWGQDGNPVNPCGDPPGGVGATLSPPTAEGGALRGQDVRTTGDPTGLDGTVIRIDPATGAAPLNNPLATSSDPNMRRIIAYGLRNPYRMTVRPGTNELWLGDVGTGNYEELNRISNPTDSTVENFGWPCYEGPNRQSGYDAANLNLCESLYTNGLGPGDAPYRSYAHSSGTYAGDPCPTGSSSISGLSFYTGSSYPTSYQGGLFFADYSRNCIWFAQKGSNGLPDMSTTTAFDVGAAAPVDLQTGPNGDLFYVDFTDGTIRRIRYTGAIPPPPSGTSHLSDLTWTSMTNGWGPVEKDTSNGASGTGDGRTITLNGTTYAKGLGAHAVSDVRYSLGESCSRFRADVGVDDEVTSTRASVVFQVYADGTKLYDSGVMGATTATKSIDVSLSGKSQLQLVVSDGGDGIDSDHGDWAAARIDCGSTNASPTPKIAAPPAGTTWKVGDVIDFSGSATDAEDGTLPASALSWTLILHHCPSNCHTHIIETWTGVASGSFAAPDHDYPSYLELQLSAIDSGGGSATTSVQLNPQSVTLTLGSSPSGLQLVINGVAGTTPFTRTVITGSTNTISAPSPQTLNGAGYNFSSWSDGGAASHNITANTSTTYTATYTAQQQGDTTPPTTSITCNTSTCATGWYKASVTVALSATDVGGSGVDVIRYTLDGSDPTATSTVYEGPFVVSATTTVKYRAWDKAGNVETTKSQLIRLDASPPSVAITSPVSGSTVRGTVKLTATASDTGSGVSIVSFYIDDGILIGTKSGAPFTISWNTKKVAVGQHTLYAVARDAAGNETTSAPITVTVQ
jgi:glucose/arabinose dehydrogenase